MSFCTKHPACLMHVPSTGGKGWHLNIMLMEVRTFLEIQQNTFSFKFKAIARLAKTPADLLGFVYSV